MSACPNDNPIAVFWEEGFAEEQAGILDAEGTA